ncbi:MAG: YcxB family protein [Spirochaetales bacterium]|nr:YcxB family protein [Spirochaetales bacterium]
MEYKYSLSIEDQKRLFFFGYYNRPFLWFQRRFFGPALIVIAILFQLLSSYLNSGSISWALTAIFLLFGIYMIFRPLILLLRIKFTDTTGTMSIDENNLAIKNEKGELIIKKDEILDIIAKKDMLFIKVRLNTVQYFIIDLKSIEKGADEFYKELLEFHGRI